MTAIASVGGRPVVFAQGNSTATNGRCALIPLDPTELTEGTPSPVSCDAASQPGAPIAPLLGPTPGTYQVLARIARLSASGTATVGPVVLSMGYYSDTRPQWVDENGSAWLYDNATPNGPRLLQISPTTGKVEREIVFPAGYGTPMLVADRAGLWVAPSARDTGGGEATIYFVPASGGAPRVVLRFSGSASFAYADASHAWFAILDRHYPTERLLSYNGGDLRPADNVAYYPIDIDYTQVVGDADHGLWSLAGGRAGPGGIGCASASLIRLDPATGDATSIGTLTGTTTGGFQCGGSLQDGQAVLIGDVLYVLGDGALLVNFNGQGESYGFHDISLVAAPPLGR